MRGLDTTRDEPLPPTVAALISRLEHLRPAAPPTVDEPATLTGPPRAASQPTLPPDYPFLAPPQQADELGRLGNFRVLRKLGRGGMGVVFQGEDPVLKRPVALKVMQPELAALPDARQRFLLEARAAAALNHEHVVPIWHVVQEPVPFIVMPLLQGEPLDGRLRREPLMPIAEVLRIGREVAEGLAAAHAKGVLHRDIKPANLWLTADSGRVLILDFGLARLVEADNCLTQAGALPGTPPYMSPEQANRQLLDARSDLFSLGCVLYEAATGRRAFDRPTVTAVLRAVAEHHPPAPHQLRPEVPQALSQLILQLLSKDPDQRPASAQAVAQALRALETALPPTPDHLAETIVTPTPPPRGRRWPARRALAALAAGLLAALGLGGWALMRDGANPASSRVPSSTVSSYQGAVDVLVWSRADGQARKLRLADPGSLPLRPGDQFRVIAHVTPSAYLYLFWIDSEGQIHPVYPWHPGQWNTRPLTETPRARLELPPKETAGYTLTGEHEGMETLVLLACDRPLAADDAELQSCLGRLPPQRPVQDRRSAVWFENGQVVEHDPARLRAHFKITEIDDPVLRLQKHLRTQLQPLGRFSAAVSFARLGK